MKYILGILINIFKDCFKTQPPVDRRFQMVSIVLNNDRQSPGTGRNRRLGFEVAL